MEQSVRRLRFRIGGMGATAECEGRILDDPNGQRTLQIWAASAEHPHILLECGPTSDDDALFSLLWRLCEYRYLTPTELRFYGPRGPGEWQAVPGGPSATAVVPAAPRKKGR
ncbi:MAG: hypothetical protein EXR76_03260 [Myxococcales bacterium]|nr:hypothetical protein [Myxococcales bacterium]